ncbi:MAG: hypothetical protein ABI867_16810 [Kofleriaceae bacterium]
MGEFAEKSTPSFDRGDPTRPVEVPQKVKEGHFDALKKFANTGIGLKVRDLPQYYREMNGSSQAGALLPEIAKRVDGKVIIECADLMSVPLHDAVLYALHAKTAITRSALADYLSHKSAYELVELEKSERTIEELRDLGGAFEILLPTLAALPRVMRSKPGLLRWYLERTHPAVAAIQILSNLDEDLVKSLDAVKLWDWLDHVHVTANKDIGDALHLLRSTTKDSNATSKATLLLARFEQSSAKREAAIPQARSDLTAALGTNDDAALLDAAARTQGKTIGIDAAVIASRLGGEPVETVYEFVVATMPSIARAVELLDHAEEAKPVSPGKKPVEHLTKPIAARRYLRNRPATEMTAALRDDATRSRIRKLVHRDVALLDLIEPEAHEGLHAEIVKDEALRQWLYEDPDPATLLWVAAGSAQGVKLGCRVVKSDKGSFGWVKQLPLTTDPVLLRRFVLNCDDPVATKFVREHVIQDSAHDRSATVNDVVATPSPVYGAGEQARLDVAIFVEYDPKQVLERLADMSLDARHALLAQPREIEHILGLVKKEDRVRAIFLLGPTLAELLAIPFTARQWDLLGYLRARPVAEEAGVFEQPKQLAGARVMFGGLDPFTVFSSLRDAATLAKALERAPDLLHWIFEDTEANVAFTRLARAPVRKIAGELMEMRSKVYEGLPAYDRLTEEGQRGFDSLEKHIEDTGSKAEADDYRSGREFDPAADKRAVALESARGSKLWDAIEQLAKNAPGDVKGMLALVRGASAKEQVELLAGKHEEAVTTLRTTVEIGVEHVFSDIQIGSLLGLQGAAEWMLKREAASTVLALVASSKATKALGRLLDTPSAVTTEWLTKLPQGAALVAQERQLLDELCGHVANPETLRAMFHVRFGVEVDVAYSYEETKKLWALGARLPPAQLNQQRLRRFGKRDMGGAAGEWADPDANLTTDAETLAGNDVSFDADQRLTAAQVKQFYGLSDQQFAEASKPKGWIIEDSGKYRVKRIEQKQFTATVLHEIGHSVDAILGEKTDLIFGIGGWKEYGIDQFEAFANDMGGLDGITGPDRTRVIDAWKQSLRSRAPVAQLVDKDHPAISNKYQHSPLVIEAKRGRDFGHNDPDKPVYKGRVFSNTRGDIASMTERMYLTAPSKYGLSAPKEYFAECYVEYYKNWVAPEAGAAPAKGGHLATWIREWFDKYVDQIKFNPGRIKPRDDA